MKTKQSNPIPQAGYRISEWTRAVGISRGLFYKLKGALAPQTVKMGAGVIITEAPPAYLERIRAHQSDEQQAAA
jgi:hypothetical protein